MSWFKKKKDDVLIPPVEAQPSFSSHGPPSYRSNASTYNASRDGDLYSKDSYNSAANYSATPKQYQQYPDDPYDTPPPTQSPYARNRTVGDPYSRGERDLETDRSALFVGADQSKVNSRFAIDGPDRTPPAPTGDEDEDVEGIKQQTRFLKQDSVQSSRNALRLAREAEETGKATLLRLGDQSEKLANTERHLDVTKGHSQRAEDNADEIKKLNRSIFIPVVGFNKTSKRREQELRRERRFQEEQEERECAMKDIRDSQNLVGRAATYGQDDDGEEGIGPRRGKSAAEQNLRKAARSRFQFEATGSDDELEEEIENNVDEIGDAASRLNKLALAMGQEITTQNQRLDRIATKTDKLTMRIDNNTERLKRIR